MQANGHVCVYLGERIWKYITQGWGGWGTNHQWPTSTHLQGNSNFETTLQEHEFKYLYQQIIHQFVTETDWEPFRDWSSLPMIRLCATTLIFYLNICHLSQAECIFVDFSVQESRIHPWPDCYMLLIKCVCFLSMFHNVRIQGFQDLWLSCVLF